MMLANHHPRDLLAFDKISVTQPFWRGFETAKSQIGIEENVFSHQRSGEASVNTQANVAKLFPTPPLLLMKLL